MLEHFDKLKEIKMRMGMEEWVKLTQDEKDKLIDEYINGIETLPFRYNIETRSYQDRTTIDKEFLAQIEELAKKEEHKEDLDADD